MKTKVLLTLASFAVLASSVSAAVSQVDSEVVVLPEYVVTAPRYTPAEREINASLAALRQAAKVPLVNVADLAATSAAALPGPEMLRAMHDQKLIRVAKL